MEGKYTYSLSAERDVKKIYKDTFKKRGLAQADKYDAGLFNSVSLLAENPLLGRKCNHIRTSYCRYESGHHVIFYRQRKKDILIVRILHKKMLPEKHL